MKVVYDGKTYENILYFSRGYEYGSFSYLDENGNECSVHISGMKSFQIIEEKQLI